jgi:hypothetical protein
MALYRITAGNPFYGLYCNPETFAGKLRMALDKAGYATVYGWEIFTHLRKDGTRRVKLWRADKVFDSTQEQQQKLEKILKEIYGSSYQGGYFIECGPWNGARKSFCIILKD